MSDRDVATKVHKAQRGAPGAEPEPGASSGGPPPPRTGLQHPAMPPLQLPSPRRFDGAQPVHPAPPGSGALSARSPRGPRGTHSELRPPAGIPAFRSLAPEQLTTSAAGFEHATHRRGRSDMPSVSPRLLVAAERQRAEATARHSAAGAFHRRAAVDANQPPNGVGQAPGAEWGKAGTDLQPSAVRGEDHVVAWRGEDWEREYRRLEHGAPPPVPRVARDTAFTSYQARGVRTREPGFERAAAGRR